MDFASVANGDHHRDRDPLGVVGADRRGEQLVELALGRGLDRRAADDVLERALRGEVAEPGQDLLAHVVRRRARERPAVDLDHGLARDHVVLDARVDARRG